MQDRFATWGENSSDESLLLAILFDHQELLAKLYIYPKNSLKKEDETLITEDWNSGKEVELPKPKEIIDRSLSEDSILPEDIRIQETGKLRRIQNEWAYYVLSNKLWQSFVDELEALKKKVSELTAYNADIFDQSKSLWERLLSQKRDRNISQEKLDSIKDDLNGVFDILKEFRKEQVKQLDQESIQKKEEFDKRICDIQEILKQQNPNYKNLFESLKQLQQEIRNLRLRKTHKQTLLKTVSELFDEVGKRRRAYGSDRINKRLHGLQEVMDKMERSLARDKNELDYQNRRSEHPGTSQLESQLRQAKINLIVDKIKSKEEKLIDIKATYDNLKKKERPPIKEKPVVKETKEKENNNSKQKAEKEIKVPASKDKNKVIENVDQTSKEEVNKVDKNIQQESRESEEVQENLENNKADDNSSENPREKVATDQIPHKENEGLQEDTKKTGSQKEVKEASESVNKGETETDKDSK